MPLEGLVTLGRVSQEFSLMRTHGLDELILFVTGRCNSRCRHCFYWREVGTGAAGLPLPAIQRISASMPPFRTLLLSGGEPTLRDDLPQIVAAFREQNRIDTASVPTNGLLPERIPEVAAAVAAVDPALGVTFNVSIDGPAELNDGIRGVPGAFQSAMRTLEGLARAASKAKNLRVYVNTVICEENVGQVVEFARFIRQTGLAGGHFFEIVRGESPTQDMKVVAPAELAQVYRDLLPIQEGYLVREAQRAGTRLLRALRQTGTIGGLANRYRHQLRVHSGTRRWDFRCQAGHGIGVIDYDGRLRICELRGEAVQLADFDYDFRPAWESETMRHAAESARRHVCDCTHTCFIGAAMRQHAPSRLLAVPLLYAGYRLGLYR